MGLRPLCRPSCFLGCIAYVLRLRYLLRNHLPFRCGLRGGLFLCFAPYFPLSYKMTHDRDRSIQRIAALLRETPQGRDVRADTFGNVSAFLGI